MTQSSLRAAALLPIVGLALVLGSFARPTAVLAQADPAVAPATSTSADGRTTTDGLRTLTTSQAVGLEASGQTVAVAGSGYDTDKGVYVALCAIPPRNALPSPCGGGVDTQGQAGAAQWISSNPPDYGVGLARPYGPSGSFSTRFTVRAVIAPGIDCRQVRCALVTRSDHTRTSDRSQDLFVPVSFRADPTPQPQQAPTVSVTPPESNRQAPGAPTPGGSDVPDVEVPDTAAPEAPKSAAPDATVSDDGTEATDGTRTLTVSTVTDIDPEKGSATAAGAGFDEKAGIYVALCATDEDPTVAPGPCSAGGESSAWISSDPPEAAADRAEPFGPGGSFDVHLDLAAVIDDETDCREVSCAIAVRFDDQRIDDRTGDLLVPVTFAKEPVPETTTTTETKVAGDEAEPQQAAVEIVDETQGGASATPWVLGAVAAVAAAGGILAIRARRSGATAGSTT